MSRRSRRRFLRSLAAGTTGVLAGCLTSTPTFPGECTHDSPSVAPVEHVAPDGWPMRGYGPANTARTPTALPFDLTDAAVAWSAPLPAPPEGQPLVAGGTVGIRTEGQYVALDAADGTRRWSKGEIQDRYPVYSHALAGDTAYLGRFRTEPDSTGFLTAVDLATGDRQWTAPTRGIPTQLAVSAETVVAGTVGPSRTNHSGVHAIARTDGSERWRVPLDDEIEARPVLAADVVVVGSDDQELLAIDRQTGGLCWRTEMESRPWRGILSGDRVVVGTAASGYDYQNVWTWQASDGTRVWEPETVRNLPTHQIDQVAVADGTVLLSNDQGVYAVAEDGGTEWTWERPELEDDPGNAYRTSRALVVAGDTVFTDMPGAVHAVDLSSGEHAGSLAVEGSVTGVAVAHGSLFVAMWTESDAGRLVAVR